jgi:GAF domain-containing protein
LVTGEPHIRFYAGAPLRARNGAKIGTLCVIGREAMQPTPQQLAGLRDLADCVEAEVRGMLAQRQHGALLTLTRITALSSEDNLMLLRDMLALGCEYLQMERAVISRIQGRSD